MTTDRLKIKIRLHDSIVGVLYMISIVLAFYVNTGWLYMAGAIALLQILSSMTRFCPVYYLLNKAMPETTPIQGGK